MAVFNSISLAADNSRSSAFFDRGRKNNKAGSLKKTPLMHPRVTFTVFFLWFVLCRKVRKKRSFAYVFEKKT